jgi:hypothetical protein
MTEPEVQRPESTDEAAEIVTSDPALNVATDQNTADKDATVPNEEVPEPTD